MTGVRLGERLLYVGSGDPALFAALAAKAGLTGRACAMVDGEAARSRIEQAAARAGVLIEVAVGSPASLPAEDAAFDVAVIDAIGGMVPQLSPEDRAAIGREVRRALRPRGRAVVVEREARGWLAALKGGPATPERFRTENAAAALLQAGGFSPVRLLGDRDGERFTEGWKKPEAGTA
jgi:SAM-dependent methyltransferase